jgi:putative ABC transport system permease protein
MWQSLIAHFRAICRRAALERDMAEEFRLHLELRAADLRASGLSESEAVRRARIEFGGVESYKERCREARGLRWIDDLRADLGYAIRTLRRAPGYAAVVLLSLMLGIGANTAIFHLLDVVRLRALPVAEADELVRVRIVGSHGGMGISNGVNSEFTHPLWEQIRDRQQAFSSIFAWGDDTVPIGSGVDTRRVRALFVSGGFFPSLAIAPLAGRLFSSDDDRPGCRDPGVVVSEPFWRGELGGRDTVTSSTLTIMDQSLPIVGVTPARFFGLEVGRSFDVVLPICSRAALGQTAAHTAASSSSILEARNVWWLTVMGRLKPGWTLPRASAHMHAISAGLFEATVPDGYQAQTLDRYRKFRLETVRAANGVSSVREEYDASLRLLFAMTGSILIMACLNIASLTVARASARRREFAMRLAIGASRGRLVRQVLAESMLLAAAGAATGVWLAPVLSRAIVSFLVSESNPVHLDLSVDWRIFAFAAVSACICCLLFGVTAALRSSQAAPGEAIKTDGRTAAGGGRRWFERLLVIVEVALSVVLLAGALLFVRSFRNLVTLEPGFERNGTLVMRFTLARLQLPKERREPFKLALLDRIRRVPQVEAAALTTHVPLDGSSWTMGIRVPGGSDENRGSAKVTWISPGYFRTMTVPLVAGRDFDARDLERSRRVAIVNQLFVRRFLAGANPIGRLLRTTEEPNYPAGDYDIVGVVKDTRYADLREELQPIVYIPSLQHPNPQLWAAIVIRSSASAAALVAAIRDQVQAVDPQIYAEYRFLDSQIRESVMPERLMAALSGFFAQLAVMLAAIGVYGLISHGVVRRRTEIGIRLALGATRGHVVGMMLKEACYLIVSGLGIGIPMTILAGRVASIALFGIAPGDPVTLCTAAVLLAAVGVCAGILPARRASQTLRD